MITSEIKKMSTIERLQAMEELWDALCQEEKEIKSPEWHQEIIEERKKKIENDEAEFISIEDLKLVSIDENEESTCPKRSSR